MKTPPLPCLSIGGVTGKKGALMRGWLIGAVLAVLPGAAQADISAILRDQGLAPAINALQPMAPGREFELGTLMALRALERQAQTATRMDLGLRPRRGGLAHGTGAPPVLTPETPARMLQELLEDLDRAQHMLLRADDTQHFTLDLRDLWLDLNGDGVAQSNEGVLALLRAREGRVFGANLPTAAPMPVRFDAADRSWLLARLHAATGVTQLALAFDPMAVLRELELRRPAANLLPRLPDYHDIATMQAERAALEAELKTVTDAGRAAEARNQELRKPILERFTLLQRQQSDLPRDLPRDAPERQTLGAEIRRLNAELNALADESLLHSHHQAELRRAIAARSATLPDPERTPRLFAQTAGRFVDALYVAQEALRRQPDAGRIELAIDHLQAMLVLDRRARAQAAAETDDDHEWLRGPHQHNTSLPETMLPPASLDDERALEEAQAVLDGRLLIPHPRLPAGTGVSLKAWAEAPGPLDPLAVVHGTGVWPWVQRGPLTAFLGGQEALRLLRGGLVTQTRPF